MVVISAQVSLYPLRSPRLSPTIDRAFAIFHAYRLDVQPGSMSTIVSGDDAAVFAALHQAFEAAAEAGQEVVMMETVSNAYPVLTSGSGRGSDP